MEKKLSYLPMAQGTNTSGKAKKIPPAVPPKKKSILLNASGVTSKSQNIYDPALMNHILSNDTNYLNSSIQHSFNDYVNQNISSSNDYSDKKVYRPSIMYANQSYNAIECDYPSQSPSLHELPLPPNSSHNAEHYLPPPSPVSSNYSELVRATNNMNIEPRKSSYSPIYQNELGFSDQPSTYESLYEPIKPAPISKGINSSYTTNNMTVSKTQLPKEAEVDALTDLLVKSISDNQDLDYFGVCVKCNEKVLGENSGCTAMGNIYHIKCFCCYVCNANLHGKRLYAVDGNPYCEEDYHETLEKCTVCNKPVLDRILRATGNPYHRSCFTCVVCNKSLDGVPFTVDAMNRIHCIEDFHKKFAPRCCVCELPIMPEEGEEETVRVVALDRSFHVNCYRCEDCGMQLSSEEEGRGCYPLDDHILCKSCNAYRIRRLTNVITTDL